MSNRLVYYTGYIPSHYTSDASLVAYQINQLSQNATDYGNNYILNGILLSNLGKGITQSNPFPIYIPPQLPQFTLSPGIIYTEQKINLESIPTPTGQILGTDQSLVLRLLTGDEIHPYGNIDVTQLRNRVNFSIDENNNLNISCISGSTFPDADINNISLEGKKIVTMIFNVFDASGWLKQGEKVNLNFIREVSGQGFSINDNKIFNISGIPLLSVAKTPADLSNGVSTKLSYPDEYSIEISNNNLNLKLLKSNYNNYYVKNFSFNLVDSSYNNILLLNTDLHFNIPATVYNLINDPSFNFIVDYSNHNSDSDKSIYIQVYNQTFVTIGNISIYNYSLQNNHLGPVGGYFNINQIKFKNYNNLISLTTNKYKIGKIFKL